jgi:hypothetical protein
MARVKRAEHARMAANSSLRIKYHLLCRTDRAGPVGKLRSIAGGRRDPRAWARRESSCQTPGHRRQLHPTNDRNQAPETYRDLPDRTRRATESNHSGQHSQRHGQAHDQDRGGGLAWPSGCDVLHVSVRGQTEPCLRLNHSPPLSRAPHPRGCATSNCLAMLNEKRIDLTGVGEFSEDVVRFG